jgi:hypothetical protein
VTDVMKMSLDTDRMSAPQIEDLDLRDEHARSDGRPGWYAVIVVLDAIAILAFVALVVIPRLT